MDIYIAIGIVLVLLVNGLGLLWAFYPRKPVIGAFVRGPGTHGTVLLNSAQVSKLLRDERKAESAR